MDRVTRPRRNNPAPGEMRTVKSDDGDSSAEIQNRASPPEEGPSYTRTIPETQIQRGLQFKTPGL